MTHLDPNQDTIMPAYPLGSPPGAELSDPKDDPQIPIARVPVAGPRQSPPTTQPSRKAEPRSAVDATDATEEANAGDPEGDAWSVGPELRPPDDS